MSKVYTIYDGKIPSIEYIDELKKMIEDELVSLNSDFSGFPSIKASNEDLPVGIKEQPVIKAKQVKTDSDHKFVTDGILSTMVDKPSKFEVEQALAKTKQEMLDMVNDIYMRIINTPNVINKLRDISNILDGDEIANGLLNTLSYKLNIEDFEAHNKSCIHMNNNDRKALNVLIKCLSGGFADWNADSTEYNSIKNKPESLPANGGNADTIANHTVRDLVNTEYDIVIGRDHMKYSEDCCDIYAKNGIIDFAILSSLLGSISNIPVVLFKRGEYEIDSIDNVNKTVIFKGESNRLSIIKRAIITMNNFIFEDISINDSIVCINSNNELKNILFNNCTIIFNRSENCNIAWCQFNNCKFEYKGSLIRNIIKFNRYTHTKPIQYIGGNNIISENI